MIDRLYGFLYGNQARKYTVLMGALIAPQILCLPVLDRFSDIKYLMLTFAVSLAITMAVVYHIRIPFLRHARQTPTAEPKASLRHEMVAKEPQYSGSPFVIQPRR